jgi:hypothetical protein
MVPMKSITTCLLALVILFAALQPRRSEAAVGLALSSTVLTVMGAVVSGGGVVAGVGISRLPGDTTLTALLGLLIGGAILGFGVIVLDGEQVVHYSALTPAEARRLGLSASELRQFNRELDQINALAAFVQAELSATQTDSVDAAAEVWSEVKNELSAEAFSGLVKVSRQLVR